MKKNINYGNKGTKRILIRNDLRALPKEAYDIETISLQSRPRNYNWETTLDV